MNNTLVQALSKQAHEDVRSDEEANGVCFKDYNLAARRAYGDLVVKECIAIVAASNSQSEILNALEDLIWGK